MTRARERKERTMEIQTWKLKDLKPYANNPRINDNAVDAVAMSIRQFGFKNPIIVDSGGWSSQGIRA